VTSVRLKVENIAAVLAGSGECRRSERVNGDFWVERQPDHIRFDELLDRSTADAASGEAVESFSSRRFERPKKRAAGIGPDFCNVEPHFNTFRGFGMKRHEPLFLAVAVNLKNAVNAVLL
jgi:hypothetical protein